jgi:hypothetical protein
LGNSVNLRLIEAMHAACVSVWKEFMALKAAHRRETALEALSHG